MGARAGAVSPIWGLDTIQQGSTATMKKAIAGTHKRTREQNMTPAELC